MPTSNTAGSTKPAKTGTRLMSYAEAIREATAQCMRADERVLLIGEGVPDAGGIFGTTLGLEAEFGPERVLDMPLSENGMTGVLIGLAMSGFRPIMIHQRVDFALLAMDQIVNTAAKWHFMFNREVSIPLVIRVLVGRGWGQGPQHSQSLQALFSHIPGLKVVMPATPYDAKGLLTAAVEDNNPVIFIEHRWLHGLKDDVSEAALRVPLGTSRVVRKGSDVTIAAFSYMTIEALRAAAFLEPNGIQAEVIDMRSARPLDLAPVRESVKRTGRLIVCDTAWKTLGVAAEVVSQVSEQCFSHLKKAPVRIALPDHPIPTARAIASPSYPEAEDVAAAALKLLDRGDKALLGKAREALRRKGHLDVPNLDFHGPF